MGDLAVSLGFAPRLRRRKLHLPRKSIGMVTSGPAAKPRLTLAQGATLS
jgi:hypothetical protein